MRYLITGGCGFIGKRVAARLLQDGASVRVLDNLSVGTEQDLSRITLSDPLRETDAHAPSPWGGLQLGIGDILDRDAVTGMTEGATHVIHLAANTGVQPSIADPFGDFATNIGGTLNVLDAARHAEASRVVFASSGAPLGQQIPPLHEEMAPRPASPYGASKLAGEGYCSAYYQSFGLETVALRFGNVYGPGSSHKSSVVAKFIKRALSGQALEVWGDGNQTRDFIYIDDIASALIAAAATPGVGGETFQIATSAETTVNTIAARLIALLDAQNLPTPPLKAAPLPPGDVARNFSDTTKARTRLNWHAVTDLDTGLAATLDWFRSGASSTLKTSERKVA